MSALMEPLDEQQAALLDIVWRVFREHQEFPVYQHVEYAMQQLGMNSREVIDSLPYISMSGYTGKYRAVDYTSGGGMPQPGSRVYLTMAGLFHVKGERSRADFIIQDILTYLRSLSAARWQIADSPLAVVTINTQLSASLAADNVKPIDAPWATAVAEHEWPSMSVSRLTDPNDVSGTLSWLTEANFETIEEYLNAITAATTPQRPTNILQYRDPNSLARAITNLEITSELVLPEQLVKKPAITRTALFGQEAVSHSDLQAGVSAIGELLGGLDVPGKNPPHPTGRLLAHLVRKLPSINQARVQDAISLMDAVREIRNSGVHPKPSAKLIAAHELLGLPFPVRDPAQTWNAIRAQMELAFSTLQEEIYAAR